MFQWMLLFALLLLSVSICVGLGRLVKGPSYADRILAIDSIGFNIIGATAIVSVMLHTRAFLAVILLLGILAFLGTIALAKFTERGVVIEHRRND